MANDILVKVGADITSFARGMQNSQKQLAAFGKASKSNEFTVGKLATAVGITTLAFKAFGMVKESVNKAFNRIDTMEQFERVMTTMTGSTEKAKAVLGEVNETVKGTAYGLDVGAKAVQGFVTSNMDVDKATATFKSWGDAVAFYGDGTNETLGSVTDALAKATAKGKVQMDTMNRLAEAGIPAMQIYADATGQSVEDVANQMQKGMLKADEFVGVMNDAMKNGTKNFASIDGAAKNAGASWSGTFDNMKAAVARGTIAIIQNIDEMLKSNGLPDMRAMIADFGRKFEEVLKKVAEAIPPTVEKLKALKDMIEPWLPIITPIAAAFGIFIGYISGLNTVIKIAQGVWAAFNFVLMANPFVLVAAGLLLIGTGLVMAYKKVEWFRNMVDAAWAWIKNAFSVALEFIKGIVKKVMSDVKGIFDSVLKQAKQIWSENGKFIMTFVKTTFANIMENIKMVMGIIKGIFQAVWPIISGIVKIAWNGILLSIKNVITIILGVIRTVLALIRGDWKGAWTAIKDTAKQIWSNIEGFFKAINLVQIGKDIINGLIRGIGSMASAVSTAAKNIAKNIKGAITSFLGIKSPSRVMRDQVGVHIGTGLAAGINKSTSAVTKAAKAQAAAAKKAVSESIKNLEVKFDTGKMGASTYIAELKKIQQQYKLTGDQARKVQREIYQASKTQAKQAEQLKKSLAKINDGVKAADNKFLDKVKSINAKLKSDIKKVQDNFKKELKSLADSIYNQVGLFDKVESKKVEGKDLLNNLKDQNAQFRSWQADLEKIQAQGVSKSFLDELRKMGVGASDEINAIANMPKSQLKEYVKAWKEKHALANAEANSQMAKAKTDMEKQIQNLTSAANTELSKAKSQWVENIRKLGTEIKKLGDFKNSGKVLGKNVINGLVKGLTTKGPLADAAKSLAKSIESTIKSTLKIKSPSRVMVALAKFVPAGLVKGIDSSIGKVRKASVRLSEAMTPEAPSVSMSYATPSGTYASLSQAIEGNVDVSNSRDSMVADAIGRLESKLENLRIEMDGREFGRAVSETVTDARNSGIRNGGRRRV